MVITVSFLGILLSICIVVFLLNKRRLISVYYSETYPGSDIKEGTLRLLTYNVAGLPQRISSARTKRYDSMLCIGDSINVYDIVNVQEDFNYNIQLYTNNNHNYKSAHRGKAMWGDGLNTFSNFPINEFRRIAWVKCNSADCLTPKGFSLARICLAKDVVIDVYNVHATAGNSKSASKARQRNLLQLAEYIDTHSQGKPLIVMGDFNAFYQSELDNMFDFIEQTKLLDSWVTTIQKGKFPQVKNDFKYISELEYNNSTESIDKILYRSSQNIIFEPNKYNIEIDQFMNENHAHLSDHLAVMCELKWKYN